MHHEKARSSEYTYFAFWKYYLLAIEMKNKNPIRSKNKL